MSDNLNTKMKNNYMKRVLYLVVIALCVGCTNSSTEKYQKNRSNILSLHDQVKEIRFDDVLIGSIARVYTLGEYLIVADHKSVDKLIHIFDKNSFNHVVSAVYSGQGPDEIANMGHIGIDTTNRTFYVSDHGKRKIFSYEVDSVVANPSYSPTVKMEMNTELFPDRYEYINDELCFGRIIEPVGTSSFKQTVAKWNMVTGEILPMKYTHPEVDKKRTCFAVLTDHDIYVECYNNYDLMSICNLNGELICNVYGPNWSTRKGDINHYNGVLFADDKIIASYSGGNLATEEYYPTQFIVYDLNGNYIKTLDIGYRISDFIYDKETKRIFMNLNDNIQFAYLDLDGVI